MYSLKEIQDFIYTYRPEGVIIDNVVLILFLIGNYDPDFIKSCGILDKYTISDFSLLKKIISHFNKLVITPQVIAELSNVSITGNNSTIFGNKLHQYLQTVINFLKLKETEERHQGSDCLWGMDLKVIGRFGFTDMTMFELSKQTKMPILTDDFDFFIYATSNKAPAINFESIRIQPLQAVFK